MASWSQWPLENRVQQQLLAVRSIDGKYNKYLCAYRVPFFQPMGVGPV